MTIPNAGPRPGNEAVATLRSLQAYITEHPQDFHMSTWGFKSERADCGAVGCIAGRIWLNDHMESVASMNFQEFRLLICTSARSYAVDKLGLTTLQAANLFHVMHWPKEFAAEYAALDSQEGRDPLTLPAARAAITCRRIDHFIETGE